MKHEREDRIVSDAPRHFKLSTSEALLMACRFRAIRKIPPAREWEAQNPSDNAAGREVLALTAKQLMRQGQI